MGALEHLSSLQKHENSEVCQISSQLIDTYFHNVSIIVTVISGFPKLNLECSKNKFNFLLQDGKAKDLAPEDVGGSLEFNTNNDTNNGFKF